MSDVRFWQHFAERISLARAMAGERPPIGVTIEAMGMSFAGIARQVGEQLLPSLNRLGTAIREWIETWQQPRHGGGGST